MKILPGLGWGDASGSVGALTISHNKGGLYMRSRTVPTNPNSSFQQVVRAAVETLAQAWRTVSAGNKALWEAFAQANPVTGALGETITLSGEQMYLRCNQRLQVYGFTTLLVPPADMTTLTPNSAVFAVDTAPAFAITLNATDFEPYYVRMTPPLSPGITNFRKYLRTLGVFEQATLAADVTAAYAARFGTPSVGTVGLKVGMHLSGFSQTNGQISVPLNSSTIII